MAAVEIEVGRIHSKTAGVDIHVSKFLNINPEDEGCRHYGATHDEILQLRDCERSALREAIIKNSTCKVSMFKSLNIADEELPPCSNRKSARSTFYKSTRVTSNLWYNHLGKYDECNKRVIFLLPSWQLQKLEIGNRWRMNPNNIGIPFAFAEQKCPKPCEEAYYEIYTTFYPRNSGNFKSHSFTLILYYDSLTVHKQTFIF